MIESIAVSLFSLPHIIIKFGNLEYMDIGKKWRILPIELADKLSAFDIVGILHEKCLSHPVITVQRSL